MTPGSTGIFYPRRVTSGHDRPRPPPRPGRADARRGPERGRPDALRFERLAAITSTTSRIPPWWRWGIGLSALLLLLVFAFRAPLADRLWPEARAQELREQAAQALRAGRLTAEDGTGARELYEAALAIDPDRNEARTGLAQVARAALAQARVATARNRFADAHRALRLARGLSVPVAQADAVAARLREREAGVAGLEGWLADAGSAHRAGRLEGSPDAALPLYQRVLALQPDRIEALEGREDALADLLQQAHRKLEAGAIAEAAAAIAAARRYDPGHAGLPEAESRLGRALEQARLRADTDLRRGRLVRAADAYRLLARIDPQDAGARRGLERTASAHARRAGRHAADFRFAEAEADLQRARALSPHSAGVADAVRQVNRARQARARLARPAPGTDQLRRVRRLLVDAEAAEARGDLLTPPGDSAFDKLRAARAIAPNHAAVKRASRRLLPAARQCFERELRGNSLGRARGCLDALAMLEGNSAVVRGARRRLAARWLAIGDERLGAGELHSAEAAVESARGLDPAVPGIDALRERLRVASAAGE